MSSSVPGTFPESYDNGGGMVIPSCAQANNIDLGNFFQSRAIGGSKSKNNNKSKKGKKSKSKNHKRQCKTKKHYRINRRHRQRRTLGIKE